MSLEVLAPVLAPGTTTTGRGPAAARAPGLRARAAAELLAAALLTALACGNAPARAGDAALDHWPSERADDMAALQRGARTFVNYCLNCHGASLMRWNRLHDIGIDDEQIRAQFLTGTQKVGDTMNVAMTAHDGKIWFGKPPPDLSVIVRARNTQEHRGTDYLYTLLRSFYRDRSTLTGWNNIVYPNIAMPNILWQTQGPRAATLTRSDWEDHPAGPGKAASHELVQTVTVFDADGYAQTARSVLAAGDAGFTFAFAPADPKAAAALDDEVADLVAYLNWMSEPGAHQRYRVGVWVMGFLVIFLLLARWLNRIYWRDIR